MYTIDFETKKIVNGSPKSPKPVGVSIKKNRNKSKYFSWGHPTKNNCSYKLARDQLKQIWDSGEQILMQNAKFDLRVAMEWMRLPYPHGRVEDSMFWTYLNDPREDTLSLKPVSDKYLDMPPEEQEELHEWILTNVPEATPSTCGAYISEAPGDLVGTYAKGDTDRTYGLWKMWTKKWKHDEGMNRAYQREILLLPIVIDMEKHGIRLSPELPKVHKLWNNRFIKGEKYLSQVTPEKPGTKAMFNSLRELGFIDESKIQYTPKGNPRYGKDFLKDYIEDKKLKDVLTTRSRLQKIVGTYLSPWLEAFKKYGRFYPYFNQTRNEEDFGTRSGRFSSNLQQIPKIPKDKLTPNLRLLIMPDEGEIMLKRDYMSQEVRVAAHYAEGSILQAFIDNPLLDVHLFVQGLIKKTGTFLRRTTCKIITFLALYGGGANALMGAINCTKQEAYELFDAYYKALPEFKTLSKEIEEQVKSGVLLRTWGGRLYDVETAKNGRQFYYRLINLLVQGSSADQIKEAMIRYHYHPRRKGRLILQVHDELVVSVKQKYATVEMEILKWAMNDIEGWDLPMLSDAKIGESFGGLENYDIV